MHLSQPAAATAAIVIAPNTETIFFQILFILSQLVIIKIIAAPNNPKVDPKIKACAFISSE